MNLGIIKAGHKDDEPLVYSYNNLRISSCWWDKEEPDLDTYEHSSTKLSSYKKHCGIVIPQVFL